jgi:hypothetical protein
VAVIIAATLPLVMLLDVLAPWIVSVLFERGAFGAEDTVRVAEVLRGWRQFRTTSSRAAAIVYYAHLLASEELHPEFFAPGLLRSVGAELGIDLAQRDADV